MHIWIKDAKGRWAVLPVASPEIDLAAMPWGEAGMPPAKGSVSGRRGPISGKALLMRSDEGRAGVTTWVLLATPDAQVFVNGLLLLSGIHSMEDRDEIRVGGFGPVYFSTEKLARVEALYEAVGDVACPRCSRRIAVGTVAVRCPGPRCGLWHHASDSSPCWTYAPTCALCPQPTDLEAGLQWTPAEL